MLLQLEIGDWIVFEEAGAYTLSIANEFNGFPTPDVHCIIREDDCTIIRTKANPPNLDNHTVKLNMAPVKNSEERDDIIQVDKSDLDVYSIIRNIINDAHQEEAFYVCNTNDIIRKLGDCQAAMPRVGIYYEVKCNYSKIVLETLAGLDVGFSCGSKEEIRKMLSLGVDPSRIIFANSTKKTVHIEYAADVGVHIMTFDNECELHKIKGIHPTAKLLITIKYDDPPSKNILDQKCGCDYETEAPELIRMASTLDMDVVGVGIHVGKNSKDYSTYRKAIAAARYVFDVATVVGFRFKWLDIEGDFPRGKSEGIEEIAQVMNSALEDHFPDPTVKMTAQLGRYFVQTAFTLASNVHSVRDTVRADPLTKKKTKICTYYVDISLYDALLPTIFEEYYTIRPLNPRPDAELHPSIVWGTTADSVDKLSKGVFMLPKMEGGDWIIVEDVGAYCMSLATEFNAFLPPKIRGIIDKDGWKLVTVASPDNKGLNMAPVRALEEYDDDSIQVVKPHLDLDTVIREITQSGHQEEAFYLCDVSEIIRRHEDWKAVLPRVSTHYAVKCNDSRVVLETLAALGANFDCASKGEIMKVLSLGVDPSRIIFAHPTKIVSHVRYAAEMGVSLMTFDNEYELHKIKRLYPTAKLVLRIKYDDMSARYVLGKKFGCHHETEAPNLLQLASSLCLDVIGVCFHIGSGSKDCSIYRNAIAAAKQVFDVAAGMGLKLTLLDIGGGFPGEKKNTPITEIGKLINSALEDYFPDPSVKVTSEPGRYYVNTAFTLVSNIHSVKEAIQIDPETKEQTKLRMYYVDVSVYGGLIPVLFDEYYTVRPVNVNPRAEIRPSVIWGPTCDTFDKISEGVEYLPEMNAGDWVAFEEAGAYTLSIACEFNGFPMPRIHNIVNEEGWIKLTKEVPRPMPWSRFALGNKAKYFRTGLSSPNKCKTNDF